MKQPLTHPVSAQSFSATSAIRISNLRLLFAAIALPNFGLLWVIGNTSPDTLLTANLALLVLLLLMREIVIRPLQRMGLALHQVRQAYGHDASITPFPIMSIRGAASELGRFAGFALEQYRKQHEVSQELAQARGMIARFAAEQHMLLTSTHHEITTQYQSVLTYANYLEERILARQLDPSIRFDFDDICESSFNLKLIAGGLGMLARPPEEALEVVPIATVMQQTMLTLAPALDRRAMKLTTSDVDENVLARSDAGVLIHVLWMMLLGMIRYAANESTLRMRALHSRDGNHVLMSIVISELAAETLSEAERAEFLLHRHSLRTPHLFAQTVRAHANVQLAEMLLKTISARIVVEPLTSFACELCVYLPSAMLPQTTIDASVSQEQGSAVTIS